MSTSCARKQTSKAKKQRAVVEYVYRRHASAFVTISTIIGVSAVIVTLLDPVWIYKIMMNEAYTPEHAVRLKPTLAWTISSTVQEQRKAPEQKVEEQLQVVESDEVPSEGKFEVSNHQVSGEDAASLKPILSTQSDEDSFMEWVLAHGAKLNGIELVVYDASASHRGLHSTKALQPYEDVSIISENLIITGEKARASTIGQQLHHYFPNEYDQTYMALFLMEQRLLGKESWWYPYLQMLPTSFSNMPINFGKAELDMLVGSKVKELYEMRLEELDDRYDSFCKTLPEFSDTFSFELFKWAFLTVYSRAFGVTIHGEEASVMVPFTDLFNHAVDYDITWTYDDERDVFRTYSVDSIAKASVVSTRYGELGNEDLLSTYGFAIPNNEFTGATIHLALQTDDPLLQKKISLMETPDTDRLSFSMRASSNDPSFQAALKMCRLVVAAEEDLQFLVKGSTKSLPLSEENERQALLLFQQAAEESLRKFPQSSEFDEELLKGANLTNNEHNIILTRLGEKKVLMWIANFVDQMVPLIGMKDVKQFNRIRLQPENKQAAIYMLGMKNFLLQEEQNI